MVSFDEGVNVLGQVPFDWARNFENRDYYFGDGRFKKRYFIAENGLALLGDEVTDKNHTLFVIHDVIMLTGRA